MVVYNWEKRNKKGGTLFLSFPRFYGKVREGEKGRGFGWETETFLEAPPSSSSRLNPSHPSSHLSTFITLRTAAAAAVALLLLLPFPSTLVSAKRKEERRKKKRAKKGKKLAKL